MTPSPEPYRPAWLSIRRANGWLPAAFTTTRLAVDGRRAGFLGGGTAKVLRIGPDVPHVAAVRLGGRWLAYHFTASRGETVSLVCGSKRWFNGAGAAIARWVLYRAGQAMCAAGFALALPLLQGNMMRIWMELPLSMLEGPIYRAIQVVTSVPGAALVGLIAWPFLVWPLTRERRLDRERWYYLVSSRSTGPRTDRGEHIEATEAVLSIS